ncbi:AMP-binding protein, partial [Streptomyces sp. LP05-1]
LRPGHRLLAVTTIAFDIAGLEIHLPLLNGACVVLADTDTARDPAALTTLARTHRATHIQATPSLWRILTTHDPSTLTGLHVLTGGEPLPTDLATTLTHHATTVTNLYGPTETTIWSTATTLTDQNTTPPIGRPIANTTLHLLDHHLTPVPPGVTGELYIAGTGLARTYHR